MESTGKDAKGKFLPGHKFSKGNPHARKVNQLRAALMKTVTKQDMVEVITALIASAKTGYVPAIRELLDRCFGKASQHVEVSGGGLFSSIEQRQLLIEILTNDTKADNAIVVDATVDQRQLPNPAAHPVVREDGAGLVQGQQQTQCLNPVPD